MLRFWNHDTLQVLAFYLFPSLIFERSVDKAILAIGLSRRVWERNVGMSRQVREWHQLTKFAKLLFTHVFKLKEDEQETQFYY